MSDKNLENGIFINGKKQVVELLQKMDSKDKSILLRNIRARNPILAKELTESCISFQSIWDLRDDHLKLLLNQTQPTILGLALSLVIQKNQRRALALINRENAMRAFDIMQKDLTQNRSECIKAQNKITQLALNLQRDKLISFY